MKKLKLAIGLFWYAITKSHTLQKGMLDCVSAIFELFVTANKSDKPIYSKMVIDLGDSHLNMWLSKGITPVERAIELAKENKGLKEEIERLKQLNK